MIKASDIIAVFRTALSEKWGYIWGMTHEMWSEAKHAEYAKKFANDSNRQNSVQNGSKWAGHWVTDCSGLFVWAFRQHGGSIAHGSNSIYKSYCSATGTLKNGSRTDGKALKPGTAVFTGTAEAHNHIGLYVGDGTVIEAQGTNAGVTTTKITNKKWTYWGELKDVSYNATTNTTTTTPAKGTAKVMAKRVALRTDASIKSDVIVRLDIGDVVEIAPETSEWTRVTYKGKTGYMMTEFLEIG